MTTNDFDTPIYDQAQQTGTEPKAGGTAPSAINASSAASASLDDLALLSESLDTNEHLDAYVIKPLDDGRYTGKLKHIDNKDGKPYTIKTAKNGTVFLYTQQELTIIDPTGAKDGLRVYDRYVSTLPDKTGAIPMVAVLKAMGVKIPAQASARDLWEMYQKAAKAEPTIQFETQWEGNLPEEIGNIYKEQVNKDAKRYAPRVLGQSKFVDKEGRPTTEVMVDCSNIGKGQQPAKAQARVSRYLSVK